MQFKVRPSSGVISAGEAQPSRTSPSHINLCPGSRVTLCPDLEDCEEMYAEVIEIHGDDVRVRALHDVYCNATERFVRKGDEFRVKRAHIFAVRELQS